MFGLLFLPWICFVDHLLRGFLFLFDNMDIMCPSLVSKYYCWLHIINVSFLSSRCSTLFDLLWLSSAPLSRIRINPRILYLSNWNLAYCFFYTTSAQDTKKSVLRERNIFYSDDDDYDERILCCTHHSSVNYLQRYLPPPSVVFINH